MKHVHLEPGHSLQALLSSLDPHGRGEIAGVLFCGIRFAGPLPRFKNCNFAGCDFTHAENVEMVGGVLTGCRGVLNRINVVYKISREKQAPTLAAERFRADPGTLN